MSATAIGFGASTVLPLIGRFIGPQDDIPGAGNPVTARHGFNIGQRDLQLMGGDAPGFFFDARRGGQRGAAAQRHAAAGEGAHAALDFGRLSPDTTDRKKLVDSGKATGRRLQSERRSRIGSMGGFR